MGDASKLLPGSIPALNGLRVVQLVSGTGVRSIDGNRMEVDFSSRESLRDCHEAICSIDRSRVGAMINLLGLQPPFSNAKNLDEFEPQPLATWLLHAVQEFSSDLRESGKDEGGWVLNVTTLDGRFGCGARGALAVSQAGTLGLCKTLAREMPGVRVKNLDLDPGLELERQEQLLIEEFFSDDGLTEVGHDTNGRWTIVAAATSSNVELAPLSIDRNSVVLITGGAVGVTAETAKELAKQSAARLILVGRSPLPEPEDPATAAHADKASLRQHLVRELSQAGTKFKPAEVEARIKRLLKDREILANLAAMRAAGSEVEYHALDVRDRTQFAALIQQIYETHGRLDGVIHGAGVVEDKLILHKTTESFARVFSTKVESALTIVRNVRPESLKFLVFFSSISARLGTVGQVDYSAANEVLNKLAAHLSATWPARVLAINWGPWDGGMVSEELRRMYTARNVQTIDLMAGARQFVAELRNARKSSPEVVIVAGKLANLVQAAGTIEASKPVAHENRNLVQQHA